jgi:hypothetical protein
MRILAPPNQPTNKMTDQRRNEIEQRWREIDRELREIANCKTTRPCDPPKREADLLIEQDALEFELGQLDSQSI